MGWLRTQRAGLVAGLLAGSMIGACGTSVGVHATVVVGGDAGTNDSAAPTTDGGALQSIFVVPASLTELADTHYYDHPWPSDLRRDANGAVVFAGLYNPFGEQILQTYEDAVAGAIFGFSTVANGYLRFGADLDPATLPASPTDTLDPHASVQLINVDPNSPEHGKRQLAQVYWRSDAGDYWPADTLVVGPALGYPLLPRTRYAIVVTSGVRAVGGASFVPSPDLAAVLGLASTDARTEPARTLYAPAVTDLGALGIAPNDVVHLAVFTTNDPTAELFSIADDVKALFPAPSLRPGGTPGETALQANPADVSPGVYDVYQGWYGPSPNYQQGTAPYLASGGGFVFANGHAVVQNTFDLRFTLVVPNAQACPMPANGYPILLYAHGTGGDYRSVIVESGSVGDAMARQCIASLGTDQIFHGVRPGAPPPGDPNTEGDEESAFYNFQNPAAMRTNTRQSAIDVVQQARLFTETKIQVPATLSVTHAPILFDGTKLLFLGHSQGGQNGPLFFAADDAARGGVLSGSSASVPITLLDKTSPAPSVAGLWLFALGLTHPSDAAELNLFHPIFSFAQTVVDPIDPLVYLGYLARHPRPGYAPKSIYQTEGVTPDGTGDTYAPPHGIEVASVATGLPLQLPGEHPVAEAAWGGLAGVAIPAAGLQGNLADGGASGVLAQFLPAPGHDGHYVIFDVPACRTQAAQFCANLAADARGRVPALP
ncbi:MAG TPA: hypothetical protein VGI39_30680 [Polyangiaceae bacterium]